LAQYHFADCRNNSPQVKLRDGRSPWQVFTKEQLDFNLEKRFQFGDLIAVGLPGDGKAWKFDMRNEVVIYVGDSADIKRGALVYWPYSHNVSERMHMWKLDMTDAQYMQFYRRKMDMLRAPLPYGEIAGAVMDFSRLREEPGGEVTSGFDQGYEVERLESRRPPVPTSDRVLRSARPTIEAATVLTVGDYLDEYGAFLWNEGVALANKTTVRTALQSEASKHWSDAILSEVMALINGVLWRLSSATQ
jgi:hypothetical protein